MHGDPLIYFLSVRICVARMAQQPSEDFACAQSVASNILIQIVLTNFFEFVERSFDERQIVDIVKAVRPIVGRIVVESQVTPGTHDHSFALPRYRPLMNSAHPAYRLPSARSSL